MTPKEFEELTGVYLPRLTRLAKHKWGDDGEDIIQEAFLRAFTHMDKWQQATRFDTWVFGYAINVHKEMARSDKLEYEDLDVLDLPINDVTEEYAVVSRWLDSLTASEKRAILGEDGISGRVNTHRARKKLRGCYD